MSDNAVVLEATPRVGKVTQGEKNRLRRAGHIPGNVYGKGLEPVSLTVEARELARVMNAGAGMKKPFELSLSGERHLVKFAEVDMHPIARTFQHVSMQLVTPEEAERLDQAA